MPYIKQDERRDLDIYLGVLYPTTIGQLNYCITQLVRAWVNRHGDSYLTFNELIGVLECSKLELYRRLVATYEDKKIEENGDVYKK